MKYLFSERSLSQLATCHLDLQLIAREALSASQVDFMIVEGHRSVERQQLLYQAGKSKIDGRTKRGKHNHTPSLALDICAIVNGKATWRECYLAYLGGVVTATAAKLLAENKVSHKLRWGGNWDSDGEIITDQSFIDLPHFELVHSTF